MKTATDTLNQLQEILIERKLNNRQNTESYVHELYQGGIDKIAKKISEEATEVIMAAKDIEYSSNNKKTQQHLINEVSDLVFHSMVILTHYDCTIEQVTTEINRRMGVSGLTEKASRK